MKVQFIWHDCFVYTDESFVIVFDYWKDPASGEGKIPLFIESADKNKHLIVVVSHHHKDHYSREIFEWENLFSKTTYVLSKDTARYCRYILKPESIYAGHKPNPENVKIIKPGEKIEIENIEIRAFGSTDIGNSYLLQTSGLKIFHAGDLNAWIWKDESTEDEVKHEIDKFQNILNEIKSACSEIDIVMFPVDPRLGTDYFMGAKIFTEEINVKMFFPMHFCLAENEVLQIDYIRKASDFEAYANKERGSYICLGSPYASFFKNRD